MTFKEATEIISHVEQRVSKHLHDLAEEARFEGDQEAQEAACALRCAWKKNDLEMLIENEVLTREAAKQYGIAARVAAEWYREQLKY